MSRFHFRYGWMSRQKLAGLLPVSGLIESLAALSHEWRRIRMQPGYQALTAAHVGRDARRILNWFAAPNGMRPPSRKRLEASFRVVEADCLPLYRQVAAWVASAGEMIREQAAQRQPPHDEMVAFLTALAKTDFPVLLLWSQPVLAERLFVADSQGGTRLASAYRAHKRPLAQAARTCLAYALAGVGRLAPRDAWIGAGFGVCDAAVQTETIVIHRQAETLIVEPDLAWIARRWTDLTPLPLEPGQLPWDYVRALLDHPANRIAAPAYRPLYTQLRDLAAQLEATPWDFQVVQSFLRTTAALLRQTVSPEDWRADPHGWWVTRYFPDEVRLAPPLVSRLREDFKIWRQQAQSQGRIAPRLEAASEPRLPYPLRLQLACPDAVRAEAEEFFDWLVEAPSPFGSMQRPYLPAEPGPAAGYWIDDDGIRFQYVDPNPWRPAERLAAYFSTPPAYCERDAQWRGLRPPTGFIDNRLVRLREDEQDPAEVAPGSPVLFYSTLMLPETMPLLHLELASPRYDAAADIAPQWLTRGSSVALSFGEVFPEDRVWLLSAEQARALCHHLRTASRLAMLYFFEAHALLQHPTWLDLTMDGKRSVLPTRAMLAWDYLLHRLRTAHGPTVLSNPIRRPIPSPVVDESGEMLPTQLLMRF